MFLVSVIPLSGLIWLRVFWIYIHHIYQIYVYKYRGRNPHHSMTREVNDSEVSDYDARSYKSHTRTAPCGYRDLHQDLSAYVSMSLWPVALWPLARYSVICWSHTHRQYWWDHLCDSPRWSVTPLYAHPGPDPGPHRESEISRYHGLVNYPILSASRWRRGVTHSSSLDSLGWYPRNIPPHERMVWAWI